MRLEGLVGPQQVVDRAPGQKVGQRQRRARRDPEGERPAPGGGGGHGRGRREGHQRQPEGQLAQDLPEPSRRGVRLRRPGEAQAAPDQEGAGDQRRPERQGQLAQPRPARAERRRRGGQHEDMRALRGEEGKDGDPAEAGRDGAGLDPLRGIRRHRRATTAGPVRQA